MGTYLNSNGSLVEIASKVTGGGGGGGTTDYNDLSNKPKINNITLSGNKEGNDLGLLDSSDELTQSQMNTLIGLL